MVELFWCDCWLAKSMMCGREESMASLEYRRYYGR